MQEGSGRGGPRATACVALRGPFLIAFCLIDCVIKSFVGQVKLQVSEKDLEGAVVVLAGEAGGMGSDEDIGQGPERVVGGEWFGIEDIERGTRDGVILQGVKEGLLVADLAASDINEEGGIFHSGEGGAIEHVGGLWGQGDGRDYHIALVEQVVELFRREVVGGDATVGVAGAGKDEAVVAVVVAALQGEDAHTEGAGEPGGLTSDAAVAHDADGFIAQFLLLEMGHFILLRGPCVLLL